jgi:hypothetical protein
MELTAEYSGMSMTDQLKHKIVELGGTPKFGYTCKVPPVSTNAWKNKDWVKWIEQTGGFYEKKEK